MQRKSLVLVILVLLLVVGQKVVLASQTITFSVRINPLVVEISAPTAVGKGQRFTVEARVSNQGARAIRKVRAELELADGLVLRKKKKTVKKLGSIKPGHVKRASWQVRAEDLGDFQLKVEAMGRESISKESISADDSMVISVSESTWLPTKWFKRKFRERFKHHPFSGH